MRTVPNLDAFRELSATGLGVLDVGSRGGAHRSLREIASLVHLVGFEPDAEECRRLNDRTDGSSFRTVRHLPYALGASREVRTFHRCRSAGASSLLRPNRSFVARFPDASRFEVLETRRIETVSLDDLRRDNAVGLPAYIGFLKLDTQGTELSIVSGAETTLGEVVAIEAEVEFAPIYEGQPLFRDIDAFLAAKGFTLFKLRRMNWVRTSGSTTPSRTAGQVVFGDALYLRDPKAQHPETRMDARQLEALILIACLYDCHDFALEVIDDPQTEGVVDRKSATRYVLDRMRRPMLRGMWKRRSDRLHLLSWLRGYAGHWARGDHDFYGRV